MLDPITFSVVLSRFDAIVEEMTSALERSAWTSILALCRDYSCGVYDAVPRQVSVYDALPMQTASLQFVMREIAAAFEGDIADGDVFLCNDPYSKNTHIGDLVTAAPVFVAGELTFWSVSRGHQQDTGAYVPSSVTPSSVNVWQEGLTIPPTRLVEKGAMRHDFLRLYLANVRYPELLEGDLRAMIGSVEKGKAALLGLCAEYGRGEILRYVDAMIEYASRRTAQELERIPDGRYEAEGWIDSDGAGVEHIPIRVAVTVDGSRVTVDYTGSAAQGNGGCNGTEAASKAAGSIPFLYYISPDIPHNEGCVDHIEVIAPEGTICNARYPASTSVATVIPSEVMQEVVNKALVEALPERVPAGGCRNGNTPVIAGGVGASAWGFVLLNSAGGGGAISGHDGWPLQYNRASLGAMKVLPIEQLELLYPVRIERAEIEPESMGFGQWLGGPGVVFTMRPLEGEISIVGTGDGCANPPHGALGGTAGIGGGQYVRDSSSGRRLFASSAGSLMVGEAELWVGVSTGGGGFGTPCERDVEAVRRDVRDELLTRATASDVFGVVLSDAADPVVDHTATEARRAALRAIARPLLEPTAPNASTWLQSAMRPGDQYVLNPQI